MEIMKFPEYRNEALKLISKVGSHKEEKEDAKKIPKIYLGTIVNKDHTQINPFYLTFLINNKLVKNCMINSRATMNIIPIDVMKSLNLTVDIPYGKSYAMENRSIPIVGVIKKCLFQVPNFSIHLLHI